MSRRDFNCAVFRPGKALVILIVFFSFFPTSKVYAKDICTFLAVIGQVLHLKNNKPPGAPAKVQEGAAKGDGVHTKVDSRAHLRLIDTSDLFIAPKSEIVIDYYLFDPSKNNETIATLVTKGLVHCITSFLLKVNPPYFFIKTEYSMVGIRGTDFYVLIGKNYTDYFVKTGRIVVTAIQNKRTGNKLSELFILEKQMEIRAGGGGGARAALKGAAIIGRDSHLGPLQAVRVVEGMPPSEVVSVPLEYFDRLEKLMRTGMPDHFQEGKDPKQLLEIMGPL